MSLGPRHICDTFWVTITQPIFLGAILGFNPLTKVNDPKSKVSLASGPFIMIKHTIFNKVGGYESIKGHIADDIGLAKLIKMSGFKLRFVNAQSLICLRMYKQFGDIWEGWSKNSFLGFIQKQEIQSKFLQVLVLLAGIFAIVDILILPFLSMIITVSLVFFLQSAVWINFLVFVCITWLVSIVSLMCVQRLYYFGKTRYVPLTLSLDGFIVLGIFINSAFQTLSGRGVTWKGRRYYDER